MLARGLASTRSRIFVSTLQERRDYADDAHRCGQRDADQTHRPVARNIATRNEPSLREEKQRPARKQQPMDMDDRCCLETSRRHARPIGRRKAEERHGDACTCHPDIKIACLPRRCASGLKRCRSHGFPRPLAPCRALPHPGGPCAILHRTDVNGRPILNWLHSVYCTA